MELLYNPDQMPESEVKATFIAREKLVDDLIALVKSQPDGAGTQHVVLSHRAAWVRRLYSSWASLRSKIGD